MQICPFGGYPGDDNVSKQKLSPRGTMSDRERKGERERKERQREKETNWFCCWLGMIGCWASTEKKRLQRSEFTSDNDTKADIVRWNVLAALKIQSVQGERILKRETRKNLKKATYFISRGYF